MSIFANTGQLLIGIVLILSSLCVVLVKKPVHASLSFLLTLLSLAALYMELSAEFISVMQILIYAGAILVIFVFVVVMFQDSYAKLASEPSKSVPVLLGIAALTFLASALFFGFKLIGSHLKQGELQKGFGSVQSLGKALYVEFFFPFEAVVLLFLVAIVGALYMGRKVD